MEEMEAGEELNRLVAERVMGWQFREERVTRPDGSSFLTDGLEPSHMWHDDNYGRYAIPPYSTDIAAAFEVIERLRSDHFRFCCIDLHSNFHYQWTCGLILNREFENDTETAHRYDFKTG